MIADAIQKILDINEPYRENVNGLEYSSKSLVLITPPKLNLIHVITLSALVDLYKDNFEDQQKAEPIFHVTSESTVEVYGHESDEYAQRTVFAKASVKESPGFRFGEWMSQEAFIIAVQAHLLDTEDRFYLLKATSVIADADSLKVEDNGVTQNATVKAGTSLNSEVTLKPRVTLKPYRTFRDVEQPQSDFIFRVRKGMKGPELALFEADGGEWKLKAMETISKFLEIQLLQSDNPAPTVIY